MKLKKRICALYVGMSLGACGIGGLSFGLFPPGFTWDQMPHLQRWVKNGVSAEQRRLDCKSCGASCGFHVKAPQFSYKEYCWTKPNQPELSEDHLDQYPTFSKEERLLEATHDEKPSLEAEYYNQIKGNIDNRLRKKWEQCMADKGYRYNNDVCVSPGNCRPRLPSDNTIF